LLETKPQTMGHPRIKALPPAVGVGFVVPLIAGGALAAWNPKLGIGAGGLTLVVAAVWKRNWAWWLVGCVTLFIALLFYFTNNDKTDNPTGSGAQA
jgi:hypothetical protein